MGRRTSRLRPGPAGANVAGMALIPCPECGHQVSTEAKSCPSCGYPLARRPGGPAGDPGEVLLAVRPSWWHYFWLLVFCWLIIPWCIAFWRRYAFVMRIYSDRLVIEEGIWSRETTEFFIRDIRSVDVRQGFWGRMVGIGDLTIATAASADGVELAVGVPAPNQIRDLLIARRRAAED